MYSARDGLPPIGRRSSRDGIAATGAGLATSARAVLPFRRPLCKHGQVDALVGMMPFVRVYARHCECDPPAESAWQQRAGAMQVGSVLVRASQRQLVNTRVVL